ncbi:MAG: hypothetical protein L6R40_008424 [Gallowayella cf. fulva]|nr:MAG: hypothetical protein L6R40_008424 [Xanthomendoza cf. fulva]
MSDYCRVLKLRRIDEGGLLDDDTYSDRDSDDVAAIISDIRPKLIELTDSEPRLNGIDVRSQSQELANGKYGLPYLMMLIFLRQVRVLELVRLTDFLSTASIRETCRLLLEPNVTSQQPLDQLQELRIMGDQNEFGESLDCFSFFLKLPHLRRISGHHVIGMYDSSPELQACWPEIEEIHLDASGIDGSVIEQLLRGTGVLKTFCYENGLFGDSDYGIYAPYQCISSLRRHASRNLEKLTLLDPVGLLTNDEEDIYEEMDFTTLHDFKVLKHAAVDCSLFIGDDNMSEKQIAEFRHHEAEPVQKVSRLVDVLPSALETLVLHRPRETNDLAAMFRPIAAQEGAFTEFAEHRHQERATY